jgi:hypothetical protein
MLGLVLGCATAAPPQQAPAAAQGGQQQDKAAVAKQDPDHTLICEDAPMTGSHIPQRICRTQRQIKQDREKAQQAVDSRENINTRLAQ